MRMSPLPKIRDRQIGVPRKKKKLMIRIHCVGLTSNMKGKLGIPVNQYSKEDLEKLGKEVREEEAVDILNHRNYGPPKKVHVCVRSILLMECLQKKPHIRLKILAIIQRKRCSLLLSFLRIWHLQYWKK